MRVRFAPTGAGIDGSRPECRNQRSRRHTPEAPEPTASRRHPVVSRREQQNQPHSGHGPGARRPGRDGCWSDRLPPRPSDRGRDRGRSRPSSRTAVHEGSRRRDVARFTLIFVRLSSLSTVRDERYHVPWYLVTIDYSGISVNVYRTRVFTVSTRRFVEASERVSIYRPDR